MYCYLTLCVRNPDYDLCIIRHITFGWGITQTHMNDTWVPNWVDGSYMANTRVKFSQRCQNQARAENRTILSVQGTKPDHCRVQGLNCIWGRV